MSESCLPDFLQKSFLLPQMMEKYKLSSDDIKMNDEQGRRAEVETARHRYVPAVYDIDSWLGCVSWNTVEQVDEILNELKHCSSVISKKMKLMLSALQDRIFLREDEGIYYFWNGHTFDPLDSHKQIFNLFKKS